MGGMLQQGDFVVGMDIGGTKMMATVMNHKFKIMGGPGRRANPPRTMRSPRTASSALSRRLWRMRAILASKGLAWVPRGRSIRKQE